MVVPTDWMYQMPSSTLKDDRLYGSSIPKVEGEIFLIMLKVFLLRVPTCVAT